MTVTPAPRGGRGKLAVAGAAAVALVALFLKFGLPILVGTAVSGVLGGVFGGPFEKLPGDQQQALEQRFETAMGSSLEGLSEPAITARVDSMLMAGLPRLGDDLLVERIRLTASLLDGSDEASCARIARASATGSDDPEAMSAALGAMETASIGRWFEINVSAIEAEAAGGPPARTVDEAAADRVLTDVFARFTEQEGQQLTDLYGGGTVPDADACGAFRALYRHIGELPPDDLAVAALYDITP